MEFISPDQKRIVMDRSRIRKVCGCAGSRKTDTMIKCGIHYLENSKRSKTCLFLTLVGSVTDEITERLHRALGVVIEKQGVSNHYLGEWKGHTIEVANYDAFIHRQLQDSEDLESFNTDFDKKAQVLLETIQKSSDPQFLLKNGKQANMLLVDEFQDISPIRAEILIQFFTKNTRTKLVVMGDMLQTIFPQAIHDLKHPLMMIDELKPVIFRLNKCFRCPKSHLDTVNCITKPFRAKYNIPEMEHHFELEGIKPLFFTHESISSHNGSFETARSVFQMIHFLLKHEPSLGYKDIVIIMKRSNHQLVFQHLLTMFVKSKKGDKCVVSSTKTFQNDHQPINWKEGKEKLMMLSVHGDKGKGHPVVFFLGFSGSVIPEERQFFKIEELLSQSLLNVAMTRSTRYLFVGMTRTYPSCYFSQSYSELRNMAYFSWHPEDITDELLKELCVQCVKTHHNPILHRSGVRKQTLLTPLKNIIFVTQDDKLRHFMKKPVIQKHKVGEKCFQKPLCDDKFLILHVAAKLLFLKKIKPRLLNNLFSTYIEMLKENRVFYTEEGSLLSSVKDFHLNRMIKDRDYWLQTIHRLGIKEFKNPVLILNSIFRDSIQKNIESFVKSPDPTTDKLDLWNTSIFYLEYLENYSSTSILFYFNLLFEDLNALDRNIQAYVDFYMSLYPLAFKRFRFHQKSSLMGILTDKEELESIGFQNDLDADRKFFNDGYRFGISSTIDFLDVKNKVVIDFKFSMKNECKEEWVFQNIMNSLLSQNSNFTKIHNVHVYNVLKGMLYTFKITSKNTLEAVVPPLLKMYEYPEILVQKLEQQIID